MVTSLKKYFLIVIRAEGFNTFCTLSRASFRAGLLILLSILAAGCSNDIFGIFVSGDFIKRWNARNTFNFLIKDNGRDWTSISPGDEYSFIVITDIHIHNGNAFGLERLKDVVDNDDNIKFAVFNGDITQNGKEEDIKTFIQIAESLGIPCYPVVGNHDVYFGNWPVWERFIGSTCYSIDAGSAVLLIMDSANAFFGARQLDWLEEELNKAEGRVFIFSHANLFVESISTQQFTDIRERARITSLLKGRCDMFFTGHSHRRFSKEIGGVTYINIEDFRDNAVYCQVWVSQDSIRWEFKRL